MPTRVFGGVVAKYHFEMPINVRLWVTNLEMMMLVAV